MSVLGNTLGCSVRMPPLEFIHHLGRRVFVSPGWSSGAIVTFLLAYEAGSGLVGIKSFTAAWGSYRGDGSAVLGSGVRATQGIASQVSQSVSQSVSQLQQK
jgi:hypothetical protein